MSRNHEDWVYLIPGHPMNQLRIGKSLGKGMEGQVFEATVGKRKYALKRERIAKQSQVLQHEISFAETFANKQTSGFMHLYAYRIVKDSTWHLQHSKIKAEKAIKFLEKRDRLPYVVEKVYTYVERIKHESGPIEFALQMIALIQRMRAAGWAHRDLHFANVVYSAKGPVVVDYSLVVHKNQVSATTWQKNCNDYMFIPNYLIWSGLWAYINKKQLDVPPFAEWIEYFKSHKQEWRRTVDLIAMYPKPVKEPRIIASVGAIVWPRLHQDFVLNEHKKTLLPIEKAVSLEVYAQIVAAAYHTDHKTLVMLLEASKV
jgi:hypothetical protein